jgi:PadR family transcriptional regulator, regulatory protein AphA
LGSLFRYIHIMNSQKESNNPTNRDRNPAEYLILGVLSAREQHGYDLFWYLEENLGRIWTLGRSQTYALLSRMEQERLVAHTRQAQEKRPDRKIFSLTSDGLKIFKNWVRRPVLHVRDLRLEFLSKLHFARVRGRGADSRLINAQIAVLEETSRRIHAKVGSMGTFIEQQTLEFRQVQTQAAITWLKNMLDKRGA